MRTAHLPSHATGARTRLEAVPRHLWSWSYDLRAGGRTLASLSLSWMAERGSLTLAGSTYEIGREGWKHGAFFLEHQGQRLASATKPSAFRRRFELVWGARRGTLRARSTFHRSFVLEEGGVEKGTIHPAHWFTRRAVVDLPDDLPLEVQAFLTWLVLVLWRRKARSD